VWSSFQRNFLLLRGNNDANKAAKAIKNLKILIEVIWPTAHTMPAVLFCQYLYLYKMTPV
jgi:hypothetical protein